jgi:hypothetical protein
MKKKNIITAALLFTVMAPLGCGGGSGTSLNDFDTQDFEVSYAKDENAKNPPAVEAVGETQVSSNCVGRRNTTEDGGVLVACKQNGASIVLICHNGEVVDATDPDNEVQTNCGKIVLQCNTEGFGYDCQ